MEKKISNIYRDAQKDISEKWDKFMKSHYPKLKDAQEKLKEAEKSGDKEKIKEAKDLYERTAKNITVNNRRYHSMLDDVTTKLANTNQIALDYINGEMPSIYAINYNAFGDEKIKGYSFSFVNENAIRELATKDELLVPYKDLDIDKDKRWNAKNVNSQVLQGILQGESIPKMAKRLRNVTDMNKNSAIRNARTMTTSAENKGRQDSFKKAQDDGVIMEREWIAAHDGNTRAWHLDLHGVIVGVDEPWENDYGEIMYPGDPGADPANVYNCRCSIRAHVKGFAWNNKKEIDESIEKSETKEQIIPTNTKELSEKWGIPVTGLQGDAIKNMDDALTFMQNEFEVDPKEYISMIDNKNPYHMRNYSAYYNPWDEGDNGGIHLHKEYAGKVDSLSPEDSAHEIMHAINGYLSTLEHHSVHRYDRIADEIIAKVYSDNGFDLNKRTGLPYKEDIARTITKYGSTNSLEAIAESALLVYEKKVLGMKIVRDKDMHQKVYDEVKRRLKNDISK